ncbi:MAG: ethylbenzene dehydrogenase-related protein [Alphaproteobacteria bacterium]|nr:ethylbenzene dehydrogenase-related protein [Alphaproteobacteria bacterium]
MTLPSGLSAAPKAKGPAEVHAVKTTQEIKIDGIASESDWTKAKPFVTYDPQAKVDLSLKFLYSNDRIYVLASFADKTESRSHKTQTWDDAQQRYRIGLDREDSFVLKWSMEPGPVDLRVDAESAYKADIWFWKAHRTDPMGFADDKMHIYSPLRSANAKLVSSKAGLRFYLSRPGDNGQSAYKTVIHADKKTDRIPLFAARQPKGSRADVRAKGVWKDGRWSIEFSRKLVTGHPDDVAFDRRRAYLFGVAKFEISGRPVNPKLDQPFFGAGEITQMLRLTFD